MKNSILYVIKNKIDNITFPNETIKDKTIKLVIAMFNQFIIDKNDFKSYKSFSYSYFTMIIKKKDYIKIIKDILVENNILEMEDTYDVNKHISKGYRFNYEIISKGKPIYINYNYSNLSTISYLSPLTDNQSVIEKENKRIIENMYNINTEQLNNFIFPILDKIKFNEDVENFIDNIDYDYIFKDIKLNENITTPYFIIRQNKQDYRYSLDVALASAKERSLDLIEYNDKFYIYDLNEFIEYKIIELKLIYSKIIFDISMGNFYGNRNTTNNRYDYNLTTLKKDLFEYLYLDNEKTTELDISSCQFAILSYLHGSKLDQNFVEMTQNGGLYEYISDELNVSIKEAKKKMLRVAFDKVKKEQDDIRQIFPKTMKFIDEYKKEYGYKGLSNLLQKTEAEIMIDGVLSVLIDNGYEVLPIHDAIRCKYSNTKQVKRAIEDYFDEINFKCFLRAK